MPIIPIPVFWTKYTTTMQGQTLKVVPCENCSTEYLYVMERESVGVGTSVYRLNEAGAAGHSQASAAETLNDILKNEFDPVPCPACGHYQRYMFPKLLETRGTWFRPVMFLIIAIGCIAAAIALRDSIGYLQARNDQSFQKIVVDGLAILLLCVIGVGLSILNRYKNRRFNPNMEERDQRIALGRSRAVTRAEFDKVQQENSRREAPHE
jgi:hypothetical protein